MKVAITSQGKDLDAPVDPRFGRTAYILIVDMDDNSIEVLDNSENVNAFKGAGIQAAASVADKGVEVLLTGYCGPKAYQTLAAAGIKVANDASGTVEEALADYKSGKLAYADGANADAHW
jgi:predicted Fe-Mo cluster-binding NifX family protein